MKREKVSQIISRIDEKYIDEAAGFALDSGRETSGGRAAPAEPAKRRARRVRWGALAACAALVLVMGSIGVAFAAEAKEYRTAVAFFEENGLSKEGLSRTEVKEVFRDITRKSFTYSKTADVIRRAVPGWEIAQDEPTPEELAALWDRNVWLRPLSRNGISYRVDYREVRDQQRDIDVLDKGLLSCYRSGELLWSAELDFYVDGYAYTKEGTAVWGWNESSFTQGTSYGWIARIDEQGTVLWQRRLEHGFRTEQVAAVLSNGDGTWAVIGRGDLKYLCLTCYDTDGIERSFHKTEVGNLGVWNAARLGDGYIVQLGHQMTGDTALLFRLDRDGHVVDSYAYEADDCKYYLTDMVEFGGRVYLSAYAVPPQTDEGGRHEIANILDYIFSRWEESKGDWEIPSEELTPLVRDNYTAVLLVCDPEGGAPETFYSVKGSLGGKLGVNDADQLEWEVESVTSTFFSPATSSFTVGGTCKVFRYTFDRDGALLQQTDTGETAPYHR